MYKIKYVKENINTSDILQKVNWVVEKPKSLV